MKALVLGTANIGLAYGKALARSLPNETQALALLGAAETAGFESLDTAAAYGLAEDRIGFYFKKHRESKFAVHTKLSPQITCADALQSALKKSRQALQRTPAQILLHRWEQKFADGGALWDGLRAARESGLCGNIGVSVQSPQEALQALKEPDIDVIQLAYNLLDWRYETPQMRDALHTASARIEVRSIFLQGLLTGNTQLKWPTLRADYDAPGLVRYLAHQSDQWTGGDPAALCLRFVKSLDWIDALVVGADTPRQAVSLSRILAEEPLPDVAIETLRKERPMVPAALLDPSQWQ